MVSTKKTVLITGCSEGGMGAALALAFHEAGLQVYATARNTSKMASLRRDGINTLELDVLSADSIANCVAQIPHLDILVNNAGASYSMPISDLSIEEGKRIFDVNVWAYLSVTQAFLPLLLESQGMIINQTSVVAVIAGPFQSAYNASKAAISMFSECQRLELAPFGVKVIDLKTGAIASNMIENHKAHTQTSLPKGSIYEPARDAVEATMRYENMAGVGTSSEKWAKEVVGDVLGKKPPQVIWRGANAFMARIGSVMPHGMMDSPIKKISGLDVVEQRVRRQ